MRYKYTTLEMHLNSHNWSILTAITRIQKQECLHLLCTWKGNKNSKVPRLSNENLQMRGKNGEPWRLTSQPMPQGGHPRARGNKVQLGYTQTTSQ